MLSLILHCEILKIHAFGVTFNHWAINKKICAKRKTKIRNNDHHTEKVGYKSLFLTRYHHFKQKAPSDLQLP
jgi:hypothetical protein